jgi:hypothetical protein
MTESLVAPFRSLFLIERRRWQVFSRDWRVTAPDGSLFLVVERPYSLWQEESILYSDEAKLQPLLALHQRSKPGALTTLHDVLEVRTGRRFGSLRGRALSSFLGALGGSRRWEILDDQERPAGAIVEEGGTLRRLFTGTSSFRIELGNQTVALLEAEFGFIRRRFWLTLLHAADPIDPRFAVACALLAMWSTLRRRGER